MLFDRNNMFSIDQAITATAASTDQIDLGATGRVVGGSANLVRDIGAGNPVPIRIQITEAFNNLTSLTIALQVDDNTSFSSATTVESVVVPLARLTLGATVTELYYVPRGTNERYARLNYSVTGSAPTTGKITAGFTFAHEEGA